MSIWLKKRTAGSAPGVEWTSDGDVQEVKDEAMALELLERGDGEFTEAKPPAGARPSAEAKTERDGREVAETGTGNATKTDAPPVTKGATGITIPPSVTSGASTTPPTGTNPTATKAGK